MKKRRPLTAGLKAAQSDPKQESAFVYGQKPAAPKAAPDEPAMPPVAKTHTQPAQTRSEPTPVPPEPATEPRTVSVRAAGRVPLTTRIRPDLASELKRASLERQLSNQTPNTVQDILEEALEPWLRNHGYLK